MRVQLRAWGRTEADVDRAVREAGWQPSRSQWKFEIERLVAPCNPLDMEDPWAIAEDVDYDWAYVAYPLSYRLSRADIVEATIDADNARELFEQAQSCPDADLKGDLAVGFQFWTTGPDGLRHVRVHVQPIRQR